MDDHTIKRLEKLEKISNAIITAIANLDGNSKHMASLTIQWQMAYEEADNFTKELGKILMYGQPKPYVLYGYKALATYLINTEIFENKAEELGLDMIEDAPKILEKIIEDFKKAKERY